MIWKQPFRFVTPLLGALLFTLSASVVTAAPASRVIGEGTRQLTPAKPGPAPVSGSDRSLRLQRPVQLSLGLGVSAGKLGLPWLPYPSLRVGYQLLDALNLYAEIEPVWIDNIFSAGAQWTILPSCTWTPYLSASVIYGYLGPGDYHRMAVGLAGGVNASLQNGFIFHFELGTSLGGVLGENFYYQLRAKMGFGYRF